MTDFVVAKYLYKEDGGDGNDTTLLDESQDEEGDSPFDTEIQVTLLAPLSPVLASPLTFQRAFFDYSEFLLTRGLKFFLESLKSGLLPLVEDWDVQKSVSFRELCQVVESLQNFSDSNLFGDQGPYLEYVLSHTLPDS